MQCALPLHVVGAPMVSHLFRHLPIHWQFGSVEHVSSVARPAQLFVHCSVSAFSWQSVRLAQFDTKAHCVEHVDVWSLHWHTELCAHTAFDDVRSQFARQRFDVGSHTHSPRLSSQPAFVVYCRRHAFLHR